MVGAKTVVATRIKEIEPCALVTHCCGHALQLAVSDTIRAIKLMRERAFNRLRKETAPGSSGYRTLCPTRWTVRAVSLQSILESWDVFQELWDEILERRVDPEVGG